MKQEFDRPTPERLREFKDAINAETLLFCNVKDAYNDEKALAFLERLTVNWRMSTDRVITEMVSSVCDGLDKRLRYYVMQFLKLQQIPFDEAEAKQKWATLSDDEKSKIVEGVIVCMKGQKGHDNE